MCIYITILRSSPSSVVGKQTKFLPERQRWLPNNFSIILILNVYSSTIFPLRYEIKKEKGRFFPLWCTGFLLGGGGYSGIYISASNICVCFSWALLIPKGTINAAEITRDLMFSWYFSISIPRWKYHENTRSRVILAP